MTAVRAEPSLEPEVSAGTPVAVPDTATPDASLTEPTQADPESGQLFRHLVDQHQKRLYRFVLKTIGNPSDAEEIAQQAFVEAAKSLVSFRGESELSTWLYGIAMNLVRNHLSRSPQRKYEFDNEGVLDTLESAEADPQQQVQNAQLLKKLQLELDGLPAEMRDVLLLVAVEDLSYEEAAILLSIPIGTVRSRLSRARGMLRARFKRAGIDSPF
jgi:RNA polymerase sigma-70 factor (ECF subfamily)